MPCHPIYALKFENSDHSGFSQRDAYWNAAHYRAAGHACEPAVVLIHGAERDWAIEVVPLHGPAQHPSGRVGGWA
jgi:hypothetical protein